MHITNGFPGSNVGKYLFGIIVVVAATMLGSLPMMVPIAIKAARENVPLPSNNNDLLNFLDPNPTFFFLLLPSIFTVAALYIVIRFLHQQTVRSLTTGRPKVDWSRIFFSFGLWAIISIVTLAVSFYFEPELYEVTFEPASFAVLAVIAILLVPIQTSAEEYVFRGYLLQGLATIAKNRWVPLVITSVVFGLLHLANPEVDKIGNIIMVYYIGTGLFLAIITLMDDGLELALGFHAANNLIGALLVTADWTAFKTPSVLKNLAEPTALTDVIIPVIVIFPIVLFIFSRKYKWSGWKEKLTGQIHNPEQITENHG